MRIFMKLNIFFLTLFLVVSIQASSQAPYFTHYPLSKRNDPVSANKIFHDNRGFVWFATNKGLYRFDGRRYRHFTLADSLPDINVTAIGQDSLGRIWTGHENGELAFLEGEKFRLFKTAEGPSPEPISDLLFDSKGNLWFSTFNDGLYYYRADTQRLYRLDEAEGMPDLFIYDLEMDQRGRVWAGTDGGLAVCELKFEKVQIDVINSKSGLPDNIIKKITFGNNGEAFLGTEDAGVIQLEIATGKVSVLLDREWKYGSITDIVKKGNQLWIGSTKPGFRLIQLDRKTLRSLDNTVGVNIAAVNSMLLDHEGNIWGGTRSGIVRTPGDGIQFIPLDNDGTPTDILAVAQDRQGRIWYADAKGLHHTTLTDGQSGAINVLAKTPYAKFRVISLYIDSQEYIWAGLYGEGVLRISPSGKIQYLNSELRNGNVLHISGKGNTVWLATLGGSEKIDITSDKLKVTHISRREGLSSDFIYQVFTDSKDRVWFATDGKGVDMLDQKGFHHYEQGLTSTVVYGFAEDKNGGIWVNGQEGGLHRWNDNVFDAMPDRFKSENIHSLISDDNGNLIVSHDLGLEIFDVEKDRVTYIGEDAGLRDHQVNLNSAYTIDGQQIFFGTTSGIVIYKREELQQGFPKIFIESVKVNGRPIAALNDLSFAYDENDLNINFLGFWYRDPETVKFSYKMDNFDPEAIVTSDNSVSYSKLPPGDYSFTVSGLLGDGIKSQQASVINFTIRPPFWKTTWFLVASAMAVGVSAFAFIRYRERQLIEDKILLEQKVEERTLEIQRNNEEIQAQNEEIMAQAEEIKGINENLEMLVQQRTAELEKKNKALEEYAFINAHKLRSPVASILGLVNLLSKAKLDSETAAINQHLKHSADELDDIVRSITEAIERGEN
jgi:ligand-binding sensor domain-containing protein